MSDETIFTEALALTDSAQRRAYLERVCTNPDQRQRIEELLVAVEGSNALDRPPVELAVTGAHITQRQTDEPSSFAGDRIGPYKLLEKIGEGGMGEVWVADQQEPIKRRVALKLIKPGMDSRSVLGRFEAERQALAVMDHPNIAKVLDAGTTLDGRPYFVMELVKGTPITEFADARKLTPRQRLELFIPVCQAIQHAHMKGIIHRDIKPSNVLVALHDEVPVPKVIDFGVAKAVGQQLTEKTIYTGFGSLVGTPAYMAPEQATFNQLDVDTRADVYALGVLLYELLAGSPPIEKDRLKKAALDEVLRIVREEEPQRPSQRLSTDNTRANIAAVRGSEPSKLSALMKGEIDWIVMKALEKDRNRRYESANGFAADVQRYLAGEPVQAVPPSFGYRIKKMYRRNKAAFLTGSAFTGLIVGAFVMGTILAIRATNAEAIAKKNEADALKAEAEAKKERDKTTDANAELQRVAYLQRKTRYAAEMNLVQAAYNTGDMTRFRALLDDQKPKPGETDIRGFEWHYWDRRLNRQSGEVRFLIAGTGEQERFPDELNNLRGKVLSADGTRIVSMSLRVRPQDIKSDGGFILGYKHSHVVYRVWDTATGRILHEYAHPTSNTRPLSTQDLQISRDGKRLAVFSSWRKFGEGLEGRKDTFSHDCWIWDFQTNAVRTIDLGKVDPKVGISECFFSEDLEIVATISRNLGVRSSFRLQRIADGMELMEIDSTSILGRIVFNPDGTHLLVKNQPRGTPENPWPRQATLQCYKVGDPKPVWEQPMFVDGPSRDTDTREYINTFQYSSDGAFVVVLSRVNPEGGKPVMKLHDIKTGEVVGQHGLKSALRILAVNAEWVAVQISPTRFGLIPMKRLREFKPKPNEGPSELPFPEYETEIGLSKNLAFSADGKQVKAISEVFDGKLKPTGFQSVLGVVRNWDILPENSASIENLIGSRGSGDGKSFVVRPSGRGARVFATGTSFPWPRLHGSDGFLIRELTSSEPTDSPDGNGFGYSGDGRFVYLGIAPKKEERGAYFDRGLGLWKRLEIYDVRANRLIRKLEPEPKVHFRFAGLDHMGKKIAILAEYEPTHEEVLKLPPPKNGRPFLPSFRRWILVYDVATGEAILKFKITGGSGDDIEFDTHGDLRSYTKTRAVDGQKGVYSPGHFVWDGKTGETKAFVPEVAFGTLQPVDHSRDGSIVAKKGLMSKGPFEIWRGDDSEPNAKPVALINYPAHSACRLSPDGTRLITYGWSDWGINTDSPQETPPPKLWDTATGRELLTFGVTPRSASVDVNGFQYQLFWSDDGTRIFVGIQRDGNLYAFDGRPRMETKP